MKGKYAVVEVEIIGGEEYQDVMCYNHILIPLWRFTTNRKISSVYRKDKRILARFVKYIILMFNL